MNRYTLSNEGRWRFRAVKTELDGGTRTTKMEGYEVLDYLYENGSGAVEEIVEYTGLSQVQVLEKLLEFINHGFIEKSANL
ncbi:hypothetical protein ACFLXD_06725 [Chloroflexota bacterium]